MFTIHWSELKAFCFTFVVVLGIEGEKWVG